MTKKILVIIIAITALSPCIKASDSTDFSDIQLFPIRRGNVFSVGFFVGGGINGSTSDDLRSSSFINDRKFHRIPVLGMKDFRYRFPFSEAYKSKYPINNNVRIAMDAYYRTNYFVDFGFNLSFDFISEYIYNEDKKLYLNKEMIPEEFTERSIVFNDETLLKAGAGLSFPLLGLIHGDQNRIDKITRQYLSLFLGVSIATPVKSRATQFLQIKESDILRYENGTDRLTVINNKELETLSSFRSYFDAVLSWQRSERMTFGIDVYFSYQLNSMLEDADWKQWFSGIRFSIFLINFWR